VVFSIFSKKPENKKLPEKDPVRSPLARSEDSGALPGQPSQRRSEHRSSDANSTRPGSRPSLEAMKEAARKTSEKIDRIESEMISATSLTANMPKPLPAGAIPATNAKPVQNKKPEANGAAFEASDSLTRSTSIVLGDSANANAIDVVGSTLPSILEEAAILFSNAQYEPAKITLEAAIQDTLPAGYASLAWLMLFDFLQLTHNRSAFDSLAMDYAARFEASPPGWKDDIVDQPAAQTASSAANFIAPAHLDDKVKSSLQTLLKAAVNKREVKIDFGTVKELDHDAAQHLLAFFKFFAAAERPLIVLHADKLRLAASKYIEAGTRDERDSIWQLSLTTLRLLGQHQAFDDLSIDFCVTYEVSPPSWEPMPIWVRGDVEDTSIIAGTAVQDAGGNSFVMRGELIGNISQERQALKEFVQNRRELTIDCRKLKRMDFTAAGELLNEVVNMRNTNKGVLFVEPNYLVYTLMMVMGLHEVAEIRTRKS
jgi:anti-anti-sigma regulatory factor